MKFFARIRRAVVAVALPSLLLMSGMFSGVSCARTECANADAFCDPFNGYLLYTDPIPTALSLFWIRSQAPRTVARANLDGSGIQNLGGTFVNSPSAMYVDGPAGVLFYNRDSTTDVRRMGLDGSGDVAFAVDASAGDPLGVTVDRNRNRLYFWNAASQLRSVARGDGSGQVLLRALTAGQIVGTYSEFEDVIYSAGGSELRRVAVDGSSEQLLNNSFTNVIDIDLDGGGGLFLTDLGANQIIKVNRDGSSPQIIASGFLPGGTAFDARNNHLYICDQTNNRILRTNATGGDLVVLTTFTPPYNPVACGLEITAGGFF